MYSPKPYATKERPISIIRRIEPLSLPCGEYLLKVSNSLPVNKNTP